MKSLNKYIQNIDMYLIEQKRYTVMWSTYKYYIM